MCSPKNVLISAGLAVACLWFFASSAHAQSDAGVWLEAGLKHKVNRKLRVSFDQHLRTENNTSDVASFMPEVGVAYRLSKRIRLGGGYRFAYKPNRNVQYRHRFHAEARVGHKVNKLRLRYRLRFQDTLRGIDAADGARYTIRNRFTLKRPVDKRTTPSVGVELFHALGNGDGVRLAKFRLTVGVARKIGRQELEFFYRIETMQADAGDPTLHILGIGFHAPI